MPADQIKVYSDKALFLPSTLEIETTTNCNINPPCVMCYPRIFDKRKFKGEIDEEANEGKFAGSNRLYCIKCISLCIKLWTLYGIFGRVDLQGIESALN